MKTLPAAEPPWLRALPVLPFLLRPPTAIWGWFAQLKPEDEAEQRTHFRLKINELICYTAKYKPTEKMELLLMWLQLLILSINFSWKDVVGVCQLL